MSDRAEHPTVARDRQPGFGPSVEHARPRLRLGFVVALLIVMAAGVVIALIGRPERAARSTAASASWWTTVGGRCTPLEVEIAIRNDSWSDVQRVVCLAVAGKLDSARARLDALDGPARSEALQAVFAIAHPIADAGDDRSAGPIMALVVEYWPENFMAMFHVGMAEFALGHDPEAQRYLTRFLAMYARDDVWRARAQKALRDLAVHTPNDRREAHFAE